MPDNFLPSELGDGEQVRAPPQAALEVLGKVGDPVGGVPFGMKKHGEIVHGGHGWPRARQGDEIGFVIEIVAAC